ncbi:hypothetical protein [Neorhodopirellula pilleata]|uniref:Uncharacterized protein n=1 Tax=Neorhodopirellula pilleata TaxID=2714738 RepID=A0A5C6A850_9BACT|nr:hypothetical protein [Neorhodopirellula pilleata]TWT95626.1 hypothetical protein Pla100_32670 [Neorhodopirellula pilleata]
MSKLLSTVVVLLLGFALGTIFSGQPPAAAVAQNPVPLSSPPATIDSTVTVIEARGGRDVAGSGDLIGFSHVDDQGTQVITLVNTQKQWMAVYHIGSSGEIRLASSRAIDADFTLQLNATSPTPEEIRRLNGHPRDRD